MSAPAKPKRKITPSRIKTTYAPPTGLHVVDVSASQTPARDVPSRDCVTGGTQINGHAITVKQKIMAVGGYFRAHCACGEFVSRPCGTEEIAAGLGQRHLDVVSKRSE